MHTRAGGLQRIYGPVPAVRGLQHHLRHLTSFRDLQPERDRVVVDPHSLQTLTISVIRTITDRRRCKIDTHDLFPVIPFHQGPPSSW